MITTLTGGVAGLFKKNKIDLIEGEGSLAGPGQVTVGEQTIAAKTIVLATGSVKRPIPGAEFGGRVIGTEEAWALDELPASMAVVGAGASGAEIASAYARLGTEVMLFEALDRVLPDRGRRHLQARRARAQEAGHDDPHRHAGHGHRRPARTASPSPTATSRARWSGWSSPPGAAPTSRRSGSTRPASSSTTGA